MADHRTIDELGLEKLREEILAGRDPNERSILVCGGTGCLEAYIGREYFLSNIRKELKGKRISIINKMVRNDLSEITPEIIMQAAARGDAFAKRKWCEMGGHLGSALVGVVNLMNPEIIIIGGGIAEAERFVFGSVKKVIKEKVEPIL